MVAIPSNNVVENMDLDQVEECKYEYPNQVYKVPVQTNFLGHLVGLRRS